MSILEPKLALKKGRIAMGDKALNLNPATLELTQRIQLHFPRDIATDVLVAWNGSSAETLAEILQRVFREFPNVGEMVVTEPTRPWREEDG
ncbi:MAG TPA: hypothetical protein VJK09_00050, partial [Candidatus Paceibacterota bacterium]